MHPRQHLSPPLRTLAARQEGVLTTAQLIDGGLSRAVIRRMARDWVNPADGLHLTSGATWLAVAWAGLLRAGHGAVLGEDAAAHLHDAVRDAPSLIAIWTEERRDGFTVGPWSVVYRRGTRKGMGSPPRTSVEVALADLARVSPEDTAVAAAARALAQHKTTPERILQELASRRRTRHSATLRELCSHAGRGIESALEWRFQRQVISPHGLPMPERQVPKESGRADALYTAERLIVELDGVRDHTDWSKDAMRDNENLVSAQTSTLRYGWHAVTGQACVVAAQVAAALAARGWEGSVRHCKRCPAPTVSTAADLVA